MSGESIFFLASGIRSSQFDFLLRQESFLRVFSWAICLGEIIHFERTDSLIYQNHNSSPTHCSSCLSDTRCKLAPLPLIHQSITILKIFSRCMQVTRRGDAEPSTPLFLHVHASLDLSTNAIILYRFSSREEGTTCRTRLPPPCIIAVDCGSLGRG